MKLGLIGYPLGHSKSPEIHRFLAGVDYSLWSMEKNSLEGFFSARDFDGINVTIPYKQEVIRFLDEINPDAREIGAVNTIANRNGILRGYNTDVLGLEKLLRGLKTPVSGADIAILGSGGAAKAALAAVSKLSGKPVIISRDQKKTLKEMTFSEGVKIAGYGDLYKNAENFTILINSTPLGMSPGLDGLPAELPKLPSLNAVVDIVANPLRTRLIFEAQQLGLETAGGLKMLVAQALAADEIFLGKAMEESLIERCEAHIRSQMQNIVLIGMPSSGKTTIGRLLAEKSGLEFIDTDEEITKRIGMSIPEYFAAFGEAAFREKESVLASELAHKSGAVIATGGGIVKNIENIRNLSHNGKLVWLDRSLELLQGTADRPLSQNAADMEKLFTERLPLYEQYADIRVKADAAPEEIAEEIQAKLEYDN